MEGCKGRLGIVRCRDLERNQCPFALNESLNGGDVIDIIGFKQALRKSGPAYTAMVFVLHSVDDITDPLVLRRIPDSYRLCLKRIPIANAAREVLVETFGEEVDLNSMARVALEVI